MANIKDTVVVNNSNQICATVTADVDTVQVANEKKKSRRLLSRSRKPKEIIAPILVDDPKMESTIVWTYALRQAKPYIEQCNTLFDDPEQYCANVRAVGQQYTQVTLEKLSDCKLQEWSILDSLLVNMQLNECPVFERTITQGPLYDSEIIKAYDSEDIHMVSTRLHTLLLLSAVPYADYCRDLFADPKQHFANVQLVGSYYTKKSLEQLVHYKDNEWVIINALVYERNEIARNITTNMFHIIDLVAMSSSAYNDKKYYEHICALLEQQQQDIVFHTNASYAATIFLMELNVNSLHMFEQGLTKLYHIMSSVIQERNPKLNMLLQMRTLVAQRKTDHDYPNIFGVISQENLLAKAHHVNSTNVVMNFSRQRQTRLKLAMHGINIQALLLLQQYVQEVQLVIVEVQANRR